MVTEKRSVGKVSSLFTFNKTEYQILTLLSSAKKLRPYTMGEILGFGDRQNALKKCRQQGYASSVGDGKKTYYSITPFGKKALEFANEYIDRMQDCKKKEDFFKIREELLKYKL